jgi:hypothetical protein
VPFPKYRWHIGTPKSPTDSTDRKTTLSDWLITFDPNAEKERQQPLLEGKTDHLAGQAVGKRSETLSE